MIENIAQDKYAVAVDSYTALDVSSKIRGKLIEKDNRNIKVDIGDNNILDIELKEDVDIKAGETVLIDRKNIAKSKVIRLKEDIKLENNDIDNYSKILTKLGMDVSEENIKALKKIESYGLEITKSNIESYLIAKSSLDDISKSLDYESAIKLVEMNIDIENESIQKIASCLDGIEEEKEGFNILKMFGKGKITTEQAEEIAKKIYGNKMGKDITDIIKALHKMDVSITKKNIEKINDVFYKLDNLKDIEDETFIDTLKNKLDINIDNLYKVKRYIKNEEIKETDNKNIVNIKGYETPIQNKPKVTNRDLKLLEEDIKDLIKEIGLEVSKENIKLSKEFIKKDIAITKENINSINEMKEALEFVVKNLDREKAALLAKENIDVETEDIRIIAEKIKLLDEVLKQPNQELEPGSIDEIIKKIELLKKVDEKDLLTLLEKNVDFKINKIEQVVFGKRETVLLDKTQDLTYSSVIRLQDALNSIDKISTAFKEIEKIDLNTIALEIKNNIPITIMSLQKSSQLAKFTDNQKQLLQQYNAINSTEVSKALARNGISTTAINIQKAMEVYRSYNNVRNNLTTNMISTSIVNNIEIENIDINLASKYVDEYRKASLNYESNKQMQKLKPITQYEKEEYASTFTQNTSEIIKNSDQNIMFLIKNKKPLSFVELEKTHLMFKNKNQTGHKISEIVDFIYENGDYESKQKVEKLKNDIIEISRNMKNSNEKIEKAYNDMEESLKDILDNLKLSHEENNNVLSKKSKELSETIEESKTVMAENKMIQFPLYMNGQFANLNMYFRDREKGNSKMSSEDMSVILSINTINMGNLNINLDVDKKNIDIKIGLENLDYKSHIESHKKILEDLLEQRGYFVGEVTFYKEGEVDTFSMENVSEEKTFIPKGNLDIKI